MERMLNTPEKKAVQFQTLLKVRVKVTIKVKDTIIFVKASLNKVLPKMCVVLAVKLVQY